MADDSTQNATAGADEATQSTPIQEAPAEETSNQEEYTPPATQEELNAIVEKRLSRERKKYADYNSVKDKAAKYDAYLESQKTEDEKQAEKMNVLQQENASLRQKIIRNDVAGKFNLPLEVVAMLNGTTEEELTEQAEKLAANLKASPAPPAVPGLSSGSSIPTNSGDWLRQALTT